jgi:hypothetical protein
MNESTLERRHRRVKTIRARFAAGAVVLFVALFGGISVQLASGHDPALAAKSTKSTKSTTGAASTITTTSVPDQSDQSAKTLSPVTTSQS